MKGIVMGSGSTLSAKAIVPSTAGVTLLPHTGSFRIMFILSVIVLAVGVATLAVAGVSALKQHNHAS